MKKFLLVLPLLLVACNPDADDLQRHAQEKTLSEAHAQVGMPEIINWQEKRMAKTLYELRDKAVSTHTYLFNQMLGCLVYVGPSVGYGLPYAAQYSAPTTYGMNGYAKPQAEPNGLFMPDSAHGTWVMLKDPKSTEVKATYIEPDVLVVPFRLEDRECKK